MDWLELGRSGQKSTNPESGTKDIAQQLQNLLQIPAIEKKATLDSPIIQIQQPNISAQDAADAHQHTGRLPESPMKKMMARYCSDLEADDSLRQGNEGKENVYRPPVGGIRKPSSSRGRGGTRTETYYPARSKPPVLSRKFNPNSAATKREITDPSLVSYLENIGYGTIPPRPPMKISIYETIGNEFPDFIDTMALFNKNLSCPRHLYMQQDLIARNYIKLDGIDDVGEHFLTIDEELKTILRAHFIEPLSRKTKEHHSAKFFCNLCKYYMTCLVDAVEHISWRSHRQDEEEQYDMYTLESVPMASDEHCEAIGELLTRISLQQDLSEGDLKQRERIIDFLKDAIKVNGIECEVNMFGSSSCGLGFRFSDLNINVTFGNTEDTNSSTMATTNTKTVVYPNTSQHFSYITRIVDILTSVPQFREVKPKYHMNKTHISFVATEFGSHDIQCLLQFNNKPALLLAGLFKEYMAINSLVRPILRAFRYWARVCQLDNQDNGHLPPHAYTIMAIYYLQDIRMIPVLHAVPKVDSSRPFATAIESFKAGFPNNSERKFSHAELGKLWLSLLYYYGVKFDNARRVVTISRTEKLVGGDSTWNRKLSIEDPIIPLTNISRSTSNNNKICNYIVNCTKSSFLYFAIPQSKEYGPLYAGIFDDRLVEEERLVVYRHLFSLPSSSGKKRLKVVDSANALELFEGHLKPIGTFKMIPNFEAPVGSSCLILFSSLSTAHTVLQKEEYYYHFESALLCPGFSAPETCKACGSEQHTRRDCPEENLPVISDVERPNNKSLHAIRRISILNCEKLSLNEATCRNRTQIKNLVYNLLVGDFPEVQLTMFGSTESGFGLKSSDVDLCMTLRSHCFRTKDDILRYIDANDTLTKIVNCLKRSSELIDVFSITTAKVPIVKYHHEPSGLDGDISFYNLLALRNTLLLKAYNQIDARVKILGCLIKKLGKLCEISDASKGSISSYAYMLMLIHYLQHTKKPVLPVLQEIPPLGHNPNEPLPTLIVENWDSYFFEDLPKLQYAWKDFGLNVDPVEELWLGFLRYYTEVFDFENHVVSIARYEPLTRREKSWYSDCIAIEDPFEKQHNLGSGLTRRMSVHIIKTLRNFRKVFHSNVEAEDVASARMHYFNRNTLVEGKLPIDRQCRICHRIGHIARNCQRQRLSDTESLDGEDDVELPTTQPGAQHGSIDSVQIPHLEEILDGRSTRPPPTSLGGTYSQEQDSKNCVLDDFRYFWNIDKPKNQEDIMLEKMITKSPGVSFSNFLKDKATIMQANSNSPEPNYYPNSLENNIYPQMFQQGLNFNTAPQTHPVGGGINILPHSMRYSPQDAIRFGMTPPNCNAAGFSNYPPPGILRLPPPPPGFAPREPVPLKMSMVPTMPNGNGQGHNIPQQMYGLPGFGQYMNLQQLPLNVLYPRNNGALNHDTGPLMDSLSWQNPHVPGTNHPRQ